MRGLQIRRHIIHWLHCIQVRLTLPKRYGHKDCQRSRWDHDISVREKIYLDNKQKKRGLQMSEHIMDWVHWNQVGLTLLTRYGHKECQRYGDFSCRALIFVVCYESFRILRAKNDCSSSIPQTANENWLFVRFWTFQMTSWILMKRPLFPEQKTTCWLLYEFLHRAGLLAFRPYRAPIK